MKRMRSKWAVLTAGMILLSAVAVGSAFAAEPVKGKVMVYTSIYLHIIEQLKPVLKQKFPELDVQWFYGGSEKVIAKLVAEFDQGATMADLIMISDPGYSIFLKREDRLLQYKSPNARYVVPAWVDKGGYFSAVRINIMGIAYNKNLVAAKDIPKTWWDMADPKWAGKVGMPNPLLSGTAFTATSGLVRSPKHGWPYFEALRKNRVSCEPGNGAVETKLLSGQLAMAMLLEENVLKAIGEKKPLGFVYPSDGPVVIPSGIAIMKTTKNPAGAKAVYDFFLSKEGQQAILSGWMHSARPDMPSPPNAAMKISEVNKFAIPMDWEALSREPEKVKDRFDRTVLR